MAALIRERARQLGKKTKQTRTLSNAGVTAFGFVSRAALALGVVLVFFGSAHVSAQNWQWPWQNSPQPPPVPREPVYRQAPQPVPQPAPQPGQGPAPAWTPKPNICLQLEQRLVQESQRADPNRELIPMIESEMRQLDQQLRKDQKDLDRDCYEYFLFVKNLRSTRKCHDLAASVDNQRRRMADLETQRQQLTASSGRSYQDDIVRELARNNCGPNYAQQARTRDSSNPFSSLWQEDDSSTSGGLGTYSNVPYATYRTLCVRLCDGYYFPISFSTLPNHFERDAELCQSKCSAPVDLYYHQNPGGAVDQMLGFRTNEPYTQLKTAFRYRKEFVQGCSCKQSEYVPETGAPLQSGSAAPPAVGATAAVTPPSAATDPGAAQHTEAPAERLPWAPR